MSASITLKTVWLNLADDPSDLVSFPGMAALEVETSQPGELQRFADGELRMMRRLGTVADASLNLPGCDRTQITWLEQHVGMVVCARDDRGRKVFGVYTVVTDERRTTAELADCSVTISQVSYPEAV